MLSPLEAAYQRHEEPIRGCLLATREILLQAEPALKESLKWGMPFFSYRGKICCYFWIDKKRSLPYIGWVDGRSMSHPLLEWGSRSRIKIMWLNPAADIPFESINELLLLAKHIIAQKLKK
ncbi:MAG: DUF1801 domain-containing protein [Bacteroidetes bacterium]|nr:MAG: DUF1801 domain-containing protein [Bacteroidota bacterium]